MEIKQEPVWFHRRIPKRLKLAVSDIYESESEGKRTVFKKCSLKVWFRSNQIPKFFLPLGRTLKIYSFERQNRWPLEYQHTDTVNNKTRLEIEARMNTECWEPESSAPLDHVFLTCKRPEESLSDSSQIKKKSPTTLSLGVAQLYSSVKLGRNGSKMTSPTTGMDLQSAFSSSS